MGGLVLDMQIVVSMIIGLALAILQLLISLSLATACVYLGINLFDKSTKHIDEVKEVKKGNIAVAILLSSVVFSIASVVQIGVENLTSMVSPSQPIELLFAGVLSGVAQLLIGIVAAVFSVNLAITVFSTITHEIDAIKELKRGNIAVAILMSGVLLSVSFVIRAGVAGISGTFNPSDILSLLY